MGIDLLHADRLCARESVTHTSLLAASHSLVTFSMTPLFIPLDEATTAAVRQRVVVLLDDGASRASRRCTPLAWQRILLVLISTSWPKGSANWAVDSAP
jgi:hypothetical protein